MLNYMTGWAFAFAAEQQLLELKQQYPRLCWTFASGHSQQTNGSWMAAEGGTDCSLVDVGYAVALTLLSALLLLFIMPFTRKIELGDGALVDWLEELLEDTWSMVARGLSVIVMVQWYDACVHIPNPKGATVDPACVHHAVGYRLDVLWAFTSTYLGTLLSTYLERMENGLLQWQQERGAPNAADQNGKMPAVRTAGQCNANSGTGLTSDVSNLSFEKACKQFSDLLQASVAWVVGCAWVDVVVATFPSLDAYPSLQITAWNGLVAVAVLLLAVLWFALSGTTYDLGISDDRDSMEKYILTSSLSFFVGWVWLVFVRNVFGAAQLLAEGAAKRLNARHQLELHSSTADLAAVFVLCPLFTMCLFRGEEVMINRIEEQPSIKATVGRALRRDRRTIQRRIVARLSSGSGGGADSFGNDGAKSGNEGATRTGPAADVRSCATAHRGLAGFFIESSRKRRQRVSAQAALW